MHARGEKRRENMRDHEAILNRREAVRVYGWVNIEIFIIHTLYWPLYIYLKIIISLIINKILYSLIIHEENTKEMNV
jgi:hypothetical protein